MAALAAAVTKDDVASDATGKVIRGLNYADVEIDAQPSCTATRQACFASRGRSRGSMSVKPADNKKSGVTFSLDLGTTKSHVKTTAWGVADATPIADIQAVVDAATAKGKVVKKIRMSRSTFRKMCKATEIISAFTLKLARVNVSPMAAVTVNEVNAYFEALMLPGIVVEPDRFCTLPDGKQTNITVDDRVVFQCADRVAVLKMSDPLELHTKLTGKVYSEVDGALIGTWDTPSGRFVDYEMVALPVFTGVGDLFILRRYILQINSLIISVLLAYMDVFL